MHQLDETNCARRRRDGLPLLGIGAAQLFKAAEEIRVFIAGNQCSELARRYSILQTPSLAYQRTKERGEGIQKSVVLNEVPGQHLAVDLSTRELIRKLVVNDAIPLCTSGRSEGFGKSRGSGRHTSMLLFRIRATS